MIASKKELIRKALAEGTGAEVAASVDNRGLRSGLKIWFNDLEERNGPLAELRLFGLKGHQVRLTLGSFSGPVLKQIRKASAEDVLLSRALVSSIDPNIQVEVVGQELSEWLVTDGSFQMIATIRDLNQPLEDDAIIATCNDVIVPIMAAMAELIGYDVLDEIAVDEQPAFEGAILQSVVQRRERNPRNRLLCVRVHGEKCIVCLTEPRLQYGDAGSIIEVHHLEPLASLDKPRPYNPMTDLVPLCPNCHRAIHTRKSVPYGVDELKEIMRNSHA